MALFYKYKIWHIDEILFKGLEPVYWCESYMYKDSGKTINIIVWAYAPRQLDMYQNLFNWFRL